MKVNSMSECSENCSLHKKDPDCPLLEKIISLQLAIAEVKNDVSWMKTLLKIMFGIGSPVLVALLIRTFLGG